MDFTKKHNALARITSVILCISCLFCTVFPVRTNAVALTSAVVGGSVILAFMTACGIKISQSGLSANDVLEYLYDKFESWKTQKQYEMDVLQVFVEAGKYKLTTAETQTLTEFTTDYITENNIDNTLTTIKSEKSFITYDNKVLPVYKVKPSNSILYEEAYKLTDNETVQIGYPIGHADKLAQFMQQKDSSNIYLLRIRAMSSTGSMPDTVCQWTDTTTGYSRWTTKYPLGIYIYEDDNGLYPSYVAKYDTNVGDKYVSSIARYNGSIMVNLNEYYYNTTEKTIDAQAINPSYPVNTDAKPITSIDIGAPSTVTTLDGMADVVAPKVDTNDLTATQTVTAEGDITDPDKPAIPPIGDLDLADLGDLLTTRFPFSIPWDVKATIEVLHSDPVPPVWTFAPLDIAGLPESVRSIEITIDLSDDTYAILFDILRWGIIILFCAGLASATKKLIWTA